MSCKPTYKGIRYNSLEELYRANGINSEQKQQAQQLYSQYLDTKQPDVILPIGTSGSGKSTFIKSLPQENLVVIEPDAMRVEFTGNMNDKSKDKEIYIEAAKRAIKAIKQGKQVVFDTTNLTKDKRLPFIEAIKKAIPTANIQYKLMELNPELAKQRIKAQLERGENRAAVSNETIDRHAESYKQMLEDIKNEPITEYKELGFKQDIQAFKEFVDKPIFDKELAQKIQDILEKLYPEIKLNITNNPIWEQGANIFDQKQALENEVAYRLKVVNSLINLTIPKGDKRYSLGDKPEVLTIRLNSKKQPYIETNLRKRLNGKGVTNQQIDFVFDYMKSNNIQEISTEQLALELASKYGFSVEINTAKVPLGSIAENEERIDGAIEGENTKTYDYLSARNFENKSKYKKEDGWEYAELDITTPLISPSIESHAGFANKKNSIGWARIWYNKKTGAVEIQEIQSDLFQKGRGKNNLIEKSNYDLYSSNSFELDGDIYTGIGEHSFYKNGEPIYRYKYEKAFAAYLEKQAVSNVVPNQFLQLLNKDNNWVTFFIKSTIQDSAKKGYEKVLFPKGETAAKIEGHETIANEIKKIDKEIEKTKSKIEDSEDTILNAQSRIDSNKYKIRILEKKLLEKKRIDEDYFPSNAEIKEIGDIKNDIIFDNNIILETYNLQERLLSLEKEKANLESQGIEKIKPIEAFYEIKVGNILEKLFGKENVKTITDEFGNQWREITINQARDLQNILLQKDEANRIIGQANVKARTALIDAVNQKQDTLPHEYAHHYIAWFRNTPIVQEAIKKWGSEEALVQSIGEQVVKQKGEAYNWWNNFVKWIMNQFNSLSKLQKEELTQILTDAFLTRQDLGSKQDIQGFKDFVQGKQYMVDNSETQYSKKENKVKPLADRKGVTYNDINNINVFC